MHDAGGKEPEVGRSPGYIYCFAQPQRFPVVVRFGQGQYIEVFIDQFGDLVKNAETFFKRGNTPFRERFPGGFNGCINILAVAVGDLPVHGSCGGIHIVDKIPAERPDEITPDKILEVKGNVELHGLKVKKSGIRIGDAGYKIPDQVAPVFNFSRYPVSCILYLD